MKRSVGWVFAFCAVAVCPAQDFSGVPGVVISHQETRYEWYFDLIEHPPRVFISDPAIRILSNGDYLAAHALAGGQSGSDSSGKTSVFRSTDRGETWTRVGPEITGLLRASIIEHDGAVYLMGTKDDAGGGVVIARSTDDGETWTTSSEFTHAGLATPNHPVVFSNRIWSAASVSSLSAPVDAEDLLAQSSWTLGGGFPPRQSSWPGDFIGEGQIVASPDLGLFILPKVKYEPLTALTRVDPVTGLVAFDPSHDFVSMPGAEKKIGAAYDEVSGRFYAFTQPILPAHEGSGIATDMIRNSAAMLSSRDLRNWRVERFILYSSEIETDGFCYMNFDFDDDDLVLVSRTAWPVGGHDPRRGHDSNLLTFHRIEDFRNASPDHYLTVSGDRILRFEQTPDPRDDDLPLGEFALGASFEGTPLSSPVALGQDEDGSVYVQEDGGRILRFDAAGNFLHTTNASPAALQAPPLMAAQPSHGECTWIHPGSGDWSDPLNWYYWGRAGTEEDLAVFGSVASAASTITIPSKSREWRFETDGDFADWRLVNITNETVSGGILRGEPTESNARIVRHTSFPGSDAPTVTVRMRADIGQVGLQLYWATTATNTFHATRLATAVYTGSGEFQDVVFSPAGHEQWDDDWIKQIRIHPMQGETTPFEIDAITIQEIPTRVKGLRFRNHHGYTLSGDGFLELNAVHGNSPVEAQLGNHSIEVPVVLANDAEVVSAPGAALRFSGGLNLAGNTLSVEGDGVVVTNSFVMNGGTLSVGPDTMVTLDGEALVLDGSLEYRAPEDFVPKAGDIFHILERSGEWSEPFTDVILPVLPAGLWWDTSELYSSGTLAVVAEEFFIQSVELETEESGLVLTFGVHAENPDPRLFILEHTTNLIQADWAWLDSWILTGGGIVTITNECNDPSGFFRFRVE